MDLQEKPMRIHTSGTFKEKRYIAFCAFSLAALWMGYVGFVRLWRSFVPFEYYSYTFLIPPVSAYLLYKKRQTLFAEPEYASIPGTVIAVSGALTFLAVIFFFADFDPLNYAFFTVLSALLFWAGGFILFFGPRSFHSGAFPLLFLTFMVPVPGRLMAGIIEVLLVGSAWMTSLLFSALAIPFTREGFVFHCPNLNLEIADACSGIRSSLTLFISTVLASHLFLTKVSTKVVLILTAIPLAFLKNGIRIVTLAMLAIYVDRDFLPLQYLHQYGGILFYFIAIGFLWLMLKLLRRSETVSEKRLPTFNND